MKQQNQNHGISRRSFLGGMVATTASGVIGSSLLAPAAQAAVSAGKSRLLVNGSHWGAFRARVENGKLVEVLPFEKDIMPVKMIDGVMGQLYSPARVRYPMVRLDWLKKGHKSDTSQRGDNRFVRVSWDKAIDLVYGELERVQKTHGPSGLYAGHTGWKHNGQINNCISALQRGVSLHGNFVKKVGDYSTGAGQVILPHVVGSTEVYSQQTSWPLVLKHSKTIVLWGTDPMKNLLTGWKTPDHGVYPYWKELNEKVDAGEIKVISVDPTVSDTQAYLGCDQVALNPQTDVPLMLAIAHTLYTEELHDAEFLEEYTVGFDKFLPYLLGKSDNQPKTAE